MRQWRTTCLRALLLILALGLGLSFPGVQAAGKSCPMAVAAAPDMPSDCGGAAAATGNAGCAALSSCPAGILPTELTVGSLGALRLAEFAPALGQGQSGPPDPFPPKSRLI
ncbi:MAG: hypothetical protein ACT4P2_10315 [Pseudomonadota bacterium]